MLFGLGNVDYKAFSGEMPVQKLVSPEFQKMVLLLKALARHDEPKCVGVT